MLRVSLHDRRFVASANDHGVSGADTVFHYRMEGPIITGTYRGGRVREGHLVGRATSADTIQLLYHCITTDGELLAGWSKGRVTTDAAGGVELDFEWAWLTGDRSGGRSHYVELRDPGPADAALDRGA